MNIDQFCACNKCKPYRGATVSRTGTPFFAKCIRCRKMVAANSESWGVDWHGDKAGERLYKVICSECSRDRYVAD